MFFDDVIRRLGRYVEYSIGMKMLGVIDLKKLLLSIK